MNMVKIRRIDGSLLIEYLDLGSRKAALERAAKEKFVLSGAKLIGAVLSKVNLFRTDLSGADLSNAYLVRANLSNAKLNWDSCDLIAEMLRRSVGRRY